MDICKICVQEQGLYTIYAKLAGRPKRCPAFQMAVDDDALVKNPFDFRLAQVVVNDSVTRAMFKAV